MSHIHATPRPWKAETALGKSSIITDNDANLHITTVDGYSRSEKEDEANAALIVEAVNHYEAMREALGKCLSILVSLDISKEEDDEEMPLIAEVKRLLAATKGA